MKIEEQIREILDRISLLEKAIFVGEVRLRRKKISGEKFTGIAGGIRFLILEKKFFKTKKTLSDIKSALAANGYHSSIQAVQTALNRLSKPGGLLVGFKEHGKKVYAERK